MNCNTWPKMFACISGSISITYCFPRLFSFISTKAVLIPCTPPLLNNSLEKGVTIFNLSNWLACKTKRITRFEVAESELLNHLKNLTEWIQAYMFWRFVLLHSIKDPFEILGGALHHHSMSFYSVRIIYSSINWFEPNSTKSNSSRLPHHETKLGSLA